MSADAQTNKQTSRHDKHKATLGPTGHAWSTHLTGKKYLSITITTSGNSSSEDGCRLGCEEPYLFLCTYIIARGSHIDVACRSICDRDHKWNQAINVPFKSRSRYQDEFWATNINQSTHFLRYLAGVATFCPWTPIVSSDQGPRNGVIKQSRTIFPDQDSWSRLQTLLQATCIWLLLV